MDLIRTSVCVGVATAVLASAVVAQPVVPRELMVGAHALLSSQTLPTLSGGVGASVDLYSRDKFTLRFAAVVTAPIAYADDRICLASPGGACFDAIPKGTQLATFVGDAVVRVGDDGRDRIFASLGRYFVNPSMHDYGGGWLIERKTDYVAGAGYERLFGGATPRYAFTLRYMRYTWVYQQSPWGLTIGVSRLFRFW